MTGGRARSLQREVVTSLAWVVFVGLLVVGLGVGAMALRGVEREAAARLRLRAGELEHRVRSGPGRLADLAALIRALPPDQLATDWWVVGAEGQLLGRSRPDLSSLPGAWLALEPELQARPLLLGGALPPRDLILAVPFRGSRGAPGMLLGRVPRGLLLARAAPVLGAAAWGLAFTAVIFLACGAWLLRRRIVLPLRALSGAARDIARGDLGTRITIAGSDELAGLGDLFNRMAASLQSERRALLETQRRLVQSERLAAAGRLASGVAHEVGNPVAAILGYAELTLRDPGLSTRGRDAQEQLRDEALRIRTLIRELLDLARSSRLDPVALEPGSLLERARERLAGQALLRGIELCVTREGDPGWVRADAARVDQVLVNLVENAAHALVGTPAPRIELRARALLAADRPQRRCDDAPLIALDVIDNGPGIDPDTLPRVFEPFFTTKEPGAGTGLGLWNAHRVAELLGGALEAESRPGRTMFSLLLPAADSQEQPPCRAGAS